MTMNISTLLISFLIALAVMEGMIVYFSGFADQYDITDDPTSNFTLLSHANDTAGTIKSLESTYHDPGNFWDASIMVISSGWTAIIILLSLPGMMIDALASFVSGSGNVLLWPIWIDFLVGAVVWTIFMMKVLSIVFKKDV